MVEVRDGVVQPRRGQIRQQTLEPAEGFGGLECLRGRFDGVIGAGFLDEDIRAPDVSVRIAMPGLAVEGRDQREHAAAEIALPGHFGGQVGGDSLHILHQRDRILKDVVVDPLEDVADRSATLAEDRAIGVIDMTTAIGLGVQELAANPKFLRHRAHIVTEVHVQSFSG